MKSSRRSLRSRIIWSTTIVTAVAMIAMVSTVILIVITLTQGRVESALSDRLVAVEATLLHEQDGAISQVETSADRIEDSAWIYDLHGVEIIGPTAGKHVHAAVVSLSDVTKRTSLHRGDHLYLAAPVKDDKTGEVFGVVVVAESYEAYESNQNIVVYGMIVLGLAVTVGTAAVAAWTIGRTLDPVNAMATSAEEWSEHNLESRFDPGSTDNEVDHLGKTLNVLLDRVAATIRGEQLLTSELAHELRTPLTAIRGEAELAMMKSAEPDTTERLDRIVHLVDRMSTTITTLVALARGHDSTGQRSRVSVAVDAVVAATRVPRGVTIDTGGVDRLIEAAAPIEMLERALAPLVDNGLRFASSRLTVKTTLTGRLVSVHVSDDGPGIDPETEVFGAGLGLALSKRVARTLGGDLRITSMADPTTFTIDVPAY